MIPIDQKTALLLTAELDTMANRMAHTITNGKKGSLTFEWIQNVIVQGRKGAVLQIAEMPPGNVATIKIYMQFIVLDEREEGQKKLPLTIYPMTYRDEENDVTLTAVILAKKKIHLQYDMVQLALAAITQQWFRDLKAVGYFPDPVR